MTILLQFADMTTSSNFSDVAVFLLSSLVTGPSFMSILLLVLELWQCLFISDWPEIQESEISRDWGELLMPSLEKMSLILQSVRVTAFIVSELLREQKHGGRCKYTPPHPTTRLGLIICKLCTIFSHFFLKSNEIHSSPTIFSLQIFFNTKL